MFTIVTMIAITLFAMLCTYYIVNVCINKGAMSDLEFFVAAVLLFGLLIFICTKDLPREKMMESFMSCASEATVRWHGFRQKVESTKNFLCNHKWT